VFSITIRYPKPTNLNSHLVPSKFIKLYISLYLENCIYKCFLQYFLKILRSGMHWHFMLVEYLWKNRNKLKLLSPKTFMLLICCSNWWICPVDLNLLIQLLCLLIIRMKLSLENMPALWDLHHFPNWEEMDEWK